MKKAYLLVVVGLLIAADTPKDDTAKKEMDRFNGTWQAVSVVNDGKEMPQEQVEHMTLTVKGDTYSLKVGDRTIEGTHKLDPSKSPKAIDAVRNEGPDKGQPIHGIYELTEDTYKVCFAPAGKDRPTEFSSKPGSGDRLITMKRVKR